MNSKNIMIGNRIRQRREKLGLTQEELGNKLLLNKSTIQRYETGKIATIKLPILHAIAKQLNVDPDWLALKTDEMGVFEPKDDWYKSDKLNGTVDDLSEPSNTTVLPADKVRMIPIFESVSAGFGAYADNHIAGYLPCYIINDQEAANTLCISVQGDSMYPKIENGDIVQVLRQDWAENGQIAVVLLDGETGLVKKYEADKNTVRLISINPEYPPKEFSGIERTRIRVLGVVKRIIKEV